MESSHSRSTSNWDRIIASLFFTAISLPLLFSVFSGNSTVSLTENRTLATRPQIPKSFHDIQSFPQTFENYFNDHFGLREQFVNVSNYLVRLLNDSPSENVVQGKQGWLFLKGEKHFSPLRDAQNLDLFTETELYAYSASILEKYRWLKARGIAYIFIVAPNKHTIYSEMLPTYIRKQNPDSALTQLMDYLKSHTQVPILDLRHPLLDSKSSSPFLLYDKYDTHWNAYGANIAQYEILKKMDQLLPNKITPHLYRDDEFRLVDSRFGDLARMMGEMESYLRGHQVPQLMETPIPYKVIGEIGPSSHVILCDSGKLSALIYRDSFFSSLQPYLTPYFRYAHYITQYIPRPTILDIQREIKIEKPDIVIEEIVERLFPVKLSAFENIGTTLAKEDTLDGEIIYDLNSNQTASIKTNELILTPVLGKASDFKVVATGNDPFLTLTGLKFKPGEKYILDIHIKSDHKSCLQFFWTSDKKTEHFTESQSFRQPIEKGDSHLSFLIGNVLLDPSLRIDFGEQPGKFTLNKLKIVKLNK